MGHRYRYHPHTPRPATGERASIGAQVAGTLFNALLGDASVLSLAQWREFWLIPAGFALVVLMLFVFSFNENSD